MLKQNLTLILCFSFAVLLQVSGTKADASKFNLMKSVNPQDPRIINGTVASLKGTEHQVSIRKRLNDGYFFGTGHVCGGSLISDNVVLCAAHCFVKVSVCKKPTSRKIITTSQAKTLKIKDILGTAKAKVSILGSSILVINTQHPTKYGRYWISGYNVPNPDGTFLPDKDFIAVMGNLDRFEKNNNTLVFDIIKVVKRVEKFNLSTFDDDIVLIMLNGTVPAKHPTVRPITLNDASLANGTICQATGWGNTEEGYSPDFLRTVDLPIIDVNDCRNKTEYGSSIHDDMLCAGYLEGERDACQGDSGGPLVCLGRQAGIISWGSGCAKPLNPGVYTNVAYFKNWVLKEVTNNNGTLPIFAPGGVSGLSCSLFLVSFMVLVNYVYNQME